MLFWLWIILLIASVVVEVMTATSLVSIWFALGALAGLIANQLNLTFFWQVFFFFAVSLISLLALRPIATKYLRGNIVPTNADRLIGMQTTLLKETKMDQYGEVKINGITWNAVSVDNAHISEGSIVCIVALSGSKLIIKKI